MNPVLLPDGTLLVPFRAEGPAGEVGDGLEPLEPGAPGYARALAEAVRPGETPLDALERRYGVQTARVARWRRLTLSHAQEPHG